MFVWGAKVDYGTTPEELQLHFNGCGTVNRVTILTDKLGNAKVGAARGPCPAALALMHGSPLLPSTRATEPPLPLGMFTLDGGSVES